VSWRNLTAGIVALHEARRRAQLDHVPLHGQPRCGTKDVSLNARAAALAAVT
jgi:hypothetical protein